MNKLVSYYSARVTSRSEIFQAFLKDDYLLWNFKKA